MMLPLGKKENMDGYIVETVRISPGRVKQRFGRMWCAMSHRSSIDGKGQHVLFGCSPTVSVSYRFDSELGVVHGTRKCLVGGRSGSG